MDLKLGGASGVPKVACLEARLEVIFGVFNGLVMREMQRASFASSEWYKCSCASARVCGRQTSGFAWNGRLLVNVPGVLVGFSWFHDVPWMVCGEKLNKTDNILHNRELNIDATRLQKNYPPRGNFLEPVAGQLPDQSVRTRNLTMLLGPSILRNKNKTHSFYKEFPLNTLPLELWKAQ